jgi:hemerythrin superfamily protein
MAPASPAADRRPAGQSQDAIALLVADHREVEAWFDDYDKTHGDDRKARLAAQICLALRVHTQIEEELLYPASRAVLDDEGQKIVDATLVEHAAARQLIGEIEAGRPGDHLYDAKLQVLCEMVEHHVDQEEDAYFPRIRRAGLDLADLGVRMAARKAELTAQLRGQAST